jgi:predicted peptidase
LEIVRVNGVPYYVEKGTVALPAYIAAPLCPADTYWRHNLDGLSNLLDDLIAQNPIDPARVYLVGFSMGGFGVWTWAAHQPERFAALLPVAGSGFKFEDFLLPADFSRVSQIPTWIVHGAQDEAVPVSGADEFAALLGAYGATYGYTRYPHANHVQTFDTAFTDMALYQWLLAQKRETTP